MSTLQGIIHMHCIDVSGFDVYSMYIEHQTMLMNGCVLLLFTVIISLSGCFYCFASDVFF